MESTESRLRALREIAVVVDGHSDILLPVASFGVDLTTRWEVPGEGDWRLPAALEERMGAGEVGLSARSAFFGNLGQYDLPRWRVGGVAAQLCAVYIENRHLGSAFARGMELVRCFHEVVGSNAGFVHATSTADIRRAKKEGRVALVLSFEGCEALGPDVRMVDLYYRLGLRVASLTHIRRNDFADGCWAAENQGGLTGTGKALVRRMEELGIVVDLAHIGEAGYWEILGLVTRPVVLSHSTPTMFPSSDPNARVVPGGILPRPRLEPSRDRERLEALRANGGVLGIIWATHASLEAVVDDIETAIEIIGPDHVGLGSDLCGPDLAPSGLEDISRTWALAEALVIRGHSDETILKFMGENYLRVFDASWSVRERGGQDSLGCESVSYAFSRATNEAR